MYKWRFMQNHIFMFYLVEIADSVLLDSFEWSESVWFGYCTYSRTLCAFFCVQSSRKCMKLCS